MLRKNIFRFSFLFFVSLFSVTAQSIPTYVVTASRENEEVLDAPALMTIITAEDIISSGKTSLVQILESIPGVFFRSVSGEADAQVSMRGFGENSFGRVVVLVDGKRLNNADMAGLNWSSISVGSIERIEVLDGPSAVLYGSGAVAGVINIITKESASGVTADASLSYGTFDTRRMRINGGIGNETAGFLISADMYQTDGHRERTANKNTNVSATGFIDVTDKLTLKPVFNYSDVMYQMPGSLTKAQFEADPTQATNLKDEGTERDFGGGLTAFLDATDSFAIELPVNYIHKDRSADIDSWFSFTDRDQHQVEAKPKSTVTADTKLGALRVVSGFDFEGVLLNVNKYSDAKRENQLYTFAISQFSYAPYISGTIELPKNIAASAGVRYDYTRIEAQKDTAKIDVSDVYQNFVYDIRLNFRPIESFSTFLKYATLYRSPFIDEKAELTGFPVDQFNTELKAESGYNVEVGIKYRFESIFSVDFNSYFMIMEDEIAYSTHNVNLDKTRRLGGAINVNFKPVSFFELNGGTSYVHASFIEGKFADKLVPLVPALTGNSAALFILPFGVSFGGTVSYTGESFAGGDNANANDKIDSYMIVGLNACYMPKQLNDSLSLNARIDNLFDVSYTPFGYHSDYSPSGYYPAAGRSFTVSASYSY